MGCVLGKTTARNRKKRTNDGGERRNSDAPVNNDVAGKRIEEVAEFRLNRGVGELDVWPTWLVAVAGDVIKDWKPRRANTFEKLDKVIQSINCFFFFLVFV